MALTDPLTLALVGLIYMLGNMVKGVTGFGAILVAVPMMSIFLEPATAIALTSASVVVSNIWQLWDSGHAAWAARRFWRLLVVLLPTTILGAQFLAVVDPRISSAVIGVMVLLFCASFVFPVRLEVPNNRRPVLDPLVGGVAGLFGGASILTGSVLIVYLVALRLEKNQFVGAIALMYLVNAIPIYATLSYFDHFTTSATLVSVALVGPAILGLMLGRRIRDRVSQTTFQRIVVGMLIAIGCLLVQRSWSLV